MPCTYLPSMQMPEQVCAARSPSIPSDVQSSPKFALSDGQSRQRPCGRSRPRRRRSAGTRAARRPRRSSPALRPGAERWWAGRVAARNKPEREGRATPRPGPLGRAPASGRRRHVRRRFSSSLKDAVSRPAGLRRAVRPRRHVELVAVRFRPCDDLVLGLPGFRVLALRRPLDRVTVSPARPGKRTSGVNQIYWASGRQTDATISTSSASSAKGTSSASTVTLKLDRALPPEFVAVTVTVAAAARGRDADDAGRRRRSSPLPRSPRSSAPRR